MEMICNRLRELIEEYEEAKTDTYEDSAWWAYDRVIDDLESILLYYE